MAYPALPDRRMPYDNDGTVVGTRPATLAAYDFGQGLTNYLTGTQLQQFQDNDFTLPPGLPSSTYSIANRSETYFGYTWMFFPESREVTAMAIGYTVGSVPLTLFRMDGSNDSTNGVDGTWETCSQPGGVPTVRQGLDTWRTGIKAISFTGGKRVIRFGTHNDVSVSAADLTLIHVYGEKVAGQTPDDIIYIDHDTTPGVEYTAPEDFGDRPLATTVTRQFRVKNTSATLTANTINIQCNDADFVISTDGTTWVVTINIASLGPGAQSATMYVRNTTPGVGNPLGPRFSRIVTTVLSWT